MQIFIASYQKLKLTFINNNVKISTVTFINYALNEKKQ